jgi:hypothetical protein
MMHAGNKKSPLLFNCNQLLLPPSIQAVLISNLPMSAGVRVWLDEACLRDHIKTSVLKGIDSSRFVVAFVTPEYIEKIAAADSVRAAMQTLRLLCFLALWHVRGLLQSGCGINLIGRRSS